MRTKESTPQRPALHVHLAGQDTPAKFTQPFRIGRAPDNDLVVDDASVSLQHAEVVFENGAWWIRDLQSTNGTIVGGRAVDRAPVSGSLRVRLGHDGPSLTLSLEGAEHHARPTLPTAPVEHSESQIIERYLGETPPEGMSRRTELVRRALKKEQERRSQKYAFLVLFLLLAAVGVGAFAFIQHQAVQRQRASAAELFYAMKSLELEVARLQLSATEEQSYGERRAELERRYQDFVEELGLYGPATPEPERLIYQVVHKLGESEVNVPREFIREVRRYIDRWRRSGRLSEAIALSVQHGYAQRISQIMLEHGMPPEFFYVAVQESELKTEAVGPQTRFGIAKGMWQLIPGTAREYGLQVGPLVGVRRFDPRDERHDFVASTRAAAQYLRDIYTTDAQASGLLVIASYNWGQTRVLRLIRTLPETPEERNFWKLLTRYRDQIPQETYDYVFSIVAATVIGENPRLFELDFEPPLTRPDVAVPASSGP
jgi:soluble lytic murein transglycosylase-like protein